MKKHSGMRPQDIVILLKIVAYFRDRSELITGLAHRPPLVLKEIARQLFISPSEVTESLNRSAYAGLIDDARRVMMQSLLEFLQHGLKYVFPQQPGTLVRGWPTAHAAKPLAALIQSTNVYVWPDADGPMRGQGIEPLYPTVVKAVQDDPLLYELLALTDAIRVGRSREVTLAVTELQKRLLPAGLTIIPIWYGFGLWPMPWPI